MIKIENRQFLKNSYSSSTISEAKFFRFLKELKIYLKKYQNFGIEESGKTDFQNLIESTDYENYEVRPEGNIDIAIWKSVEKNEQKQLEVFIETKKGNSFEMISDENFAKKSFAQICYYYSEFGKSALKHLIITDYKTLYLFKASEIEKIVSSNQFPNYRKKAKTPEIYSEILESFDFSEIEYTKIDFSKMKISEIENLEKDIQTKDEKLFKFKRELTAIYKLFSPKNLLEIDADKDMNSLDESFYQELLHIFGVEEKKIDGIQKIVRKNERDFGSILELTFLEMADSRVKHENDNNKFDKAFELNIIWLNRILFLKLLEARLVFMHSNFEPFLNMTSFRELNNLFFEIMAVEINQRKPHLKKFEKIPYMNSSLFEKKNLEENLFEIRQLDSNVEIEIMENSVLQTDKIKLKTLDYLFKFLDAYDFGSNKYQEVAKIDKTLIKSSVLGLIFEKVNGYKDGSHFTPSFITTKLAKDSLDRVSTNLENIKVLDPAVGSGHILVSVLNELVVRQAEIQGKFGKNRDIKIENDEIFISDEIQYIEDENGNFPEIAENIQVEIFHLKEKIIENNLFGVDINSNSVEIARLRLWIELLKWSYYDENGKFTTLPNIDINIKVGNSLLSRFEVDEKLDKKKAGQLLTLVKEYIQIKEKNRKKIIRKEIEEIKDSFTDKLGIENFDIKKITKLLDDYQTKNGFQGISDFTERYTTGSLFPADKVSKSWKKDLKPILELHQKIQFLENMPESFEWRFEFPEVLDESGNFQGFDLIVANPPYIRVQGLDKDKSEYYKKMFKSAVGSYDIYVLFVEKFLPLLKDGGNMNFIMPHKWINSSFGKGLREITNHNISQFISFGEYLIFDNAMTYTSLLMLHKEKQEKLKYIEFVETPKTKEERKELLKNDEKHEEVSQFLQNLTDKDFINLKTENLNSEPWIFKEKKVMDILEKLEKQPLRVSDIFERIFVGVSTSKDDIFLLECSEIKNDKNCLNCFSKEMTKREISKTFKFEKKFLKPILKGNDVHRYEKLKNKFWVIFPYKFINGKAELYSENEIIEQFPESYKYLKFFEKDFRGRERGKLLNDEFWFRYIYPKGLNGVERPKIITPQLSLKSQLSFDENGSFYLKDGTYGFVKYPEIKTDDKFYLAILNSKVMWFFIKNTGAVFSGGYYYYKPTYLKPFPIPASTPESEKVLTALVDKILKLKSENKETKELENEIDEIVLKLYGLTENEIEVINI